MMNPTARTMVSEVKRFLINSKMLLRDGLGATVQMVFREFCICPNTVVAPTNIAKMPTIVAIRPPSLRLELLTACCTV